LQAVRLLLLKGCSYLQENDMADHSAHKTQPTPHTPQPRRAEPSQNVSPKSSPNSSPNASQDDSRTAAQKEEAERTDPRRTRQEPKQTAEVPLGTSTHGEPPGGGGRQSQRAMPDRGKDHGEKH
jgi:hypothetical protein